MKFKYIWYSVIFCFLSLPTLQSFYEITYPTKLYSPCLLFLTAEEKKSALPIISMIKKLAFPLSCYFYYNIKKNSIQTEFLTSPYTTCSTCVFLYFYLQYTYKKNQYEIAHQEIKNLLQELFHLLVIAQGIHNLITTARSFEHKLTITTNSSFYALQELLHNAYQTWSILSTYYQELYQQESLYTYYPKQFGLFEIIQASKLYEDLFPLIIKFCNPGNSYTKYANIIGILESMLQAINQKAKK